MVIEVTGNTKIIDIFKIWALQDIEFQEYMTKSRAKFKKRYGKYMEDKNDE